MHFANRRCVAAFAGALAPAEGGGSEGQKKMESAKEMRSLTESKSSHPFRVPTAAFLKGRIPCVQQSGWHVLPGWGAEGGVGAHLAGFAAVWGPASTLQTCSGSRGFRSGAGWTVEGEGVHPAIRWKVQDPKPGVFERFLDPPVHPTLPPPHPTVRI